VKVGGQWKYLFWAVDKHGRLIDFLLSDRRNTGAAHRFLGKALTTMRHWPPSSITTAGHARHSITRLHRKRAAEEAARCIARRLDHHVRILLHLCLLLFVKLRLLFRDAVGVLANGR